MRTTIDDRTRDRPLPLSLEDVGLGQRVRVLGVCYQGPRATGDSTEIRPGAELLCVDRHAGAVVVRTESGRSRKLAISTASSISVELLEDQR